MPLVSVIIPAYNRADLIPETLESVLQQTFRDFEVIVVDDGSTDNTCEVVSKFPVTCLKQPNRGAPNARNTGIKLSTGRYIAILDSDDCLLPTSLENRVALLEKYPEAALAYGQAAVMEAGGRLTSFKYPVFPQSGLRNGLQELRQLLYRNHIPLSTVMLRRTCLDRVGLFNPHYIHGQEDLELWVRLASAFDLAYLAEPVVKLRMHSHRFTDHLKLEQEENNHKAIIDSVLHNPSLQPMFAWEAQRIYAYMYQYLAEVAYSRQAMQPLRNYVSQFFMLYPRGLFSRSGIRSLAMLLLTLAPPSVLNMHRSFKNRFQRLKKPRWQLQH